MKKLIYASAFLASLSLISCGGESKNENATTTGTTSSPDKAAPAAVNEADWELKNVGELFKDTSVPAFEMKLSKDATIVKDTVLGSLEVTFKNNYKLRIVYSSVMLKPEWKLADQIAERRKSSDIEMHFPETEVKVLAENANGYSYTTNTKGSGSAPTAHFYYFVADKKGGYMTINDGVAIGMDSDQEANLYSAANTKKIWDIIASSATFK